MDNNGFGNAFSDIMSGIVTLTADGEPLHDGDPFNCYFDYDAGGNNTVDFGFYDPSINTSNEDQNLSDSGIKIYPVPVGDQLTIHGNLRFYTIEIYDATGRIIYQTDSAKTVHTVDMSSIPVGLYLVKATRQSDQKVFMQKIVKL
jgi:hypothetical protein